MNRLCSPTGPVLRSSSVAFLLLIAAATGAVAESLVWPSPPAQPVVRFESEVRKLVDFELAIQGPTEGTKRVQKLKRPSGVAFDDRGRLLVSDSRQGALMMIDADLGVVLVYGTGTMPALREPMGIAVAADGTIFVADSGLRGAVAFDPGGEIVGVYGDEQMQEPTDVALSPDGTRLYVADAGANNVAIFDVKSEQRVDTFGQRGAGIAEFQFPTAVEFDSGGRMYVVDQVNTRVQVFDASGRFTRALQRADGDRVARPSDVAIDSAGRVFVTDVAQSQVVVYGDDMNPLLEFGRNGLRAGEFLGVGGLATANDKLAVLDRAGGRILLFGLDGIESAAPAQSGIQTMPAPDPPAEVAPMEATELVEPEPEVEPSLEVSPAVEETAAQAAELEPAIEPTPEPEEPSMTMEPSPEAELIEQVQAWADAWSTQDVDSYLSFYDEAFLPATGIGHEEWAAQRRQRLGAPKSIDVELEALEVDLLGPESAEVTFVQSYNSDSFSDRVRKTLRMNRSQGAWKIALETVIETLSSP